MSDRPFASCQQRFQEHLAGNQPCLQLAEWFAAVLTPFFAYLTSLGVQGVDGIAPAHVQGFRAQLLETAWSPSQQTLCWEAALCPTAKRPLMLLPPSQWLFAVRLFLHFLWQDGVLPSNRADEVAALPLGPLRRQSLGDLEAEALLLAPGLAMDRWRPAVQTATALRDQAVLNVLYRAGATPAEVRASKLAPLTLTCGELVHPPRPGSGPAHPPGTVYPGVCPSLPRRWPPPPGAEPSRGGALPDGGRQAP